MTTQITITDTKTDSASFEPVEGRYNVNATSLELEDISPCDVEKSIAEELSNKHGFAIKVQIFNSRGRAITGEIPSEGSFLATRN